MKDKMKKDKTNIENYITSNKNDDYIYEALTSKQEDLILMRENE